MVPIEISSHIAIRLLHTPWAYFASFVHNTQRGRQTERSEQATYAGHSDRSVCLPRCVLCPNGARQAYSVYRSRIGRLSRHLDWYHFRPPWSTLTGGVELEGHKLSLVQRFAHPRCHGNLKNGEFGQPTNGLLKTIEGHVLLNFEAASISSFRESQNQPFV